MHRSITTLAILSIICSLSLAQYGDDGHTTQDVCRGLLDNANATGVQQRDAFDRSIILGHWKVAVRTNYSVETIYNASSTANATFPDASANIWLDPFKGEDLNDGTNPYSACAYIIKQIPENTNRLGQDDPTNCESTLSQSCINALTHQAEETAKWLVQDPTLGPYSNLTPPILGPICTQIKGQLEGEDTMPSQCRPYFYKGNTKDLPDPDVEYPVFDELRLTDNETKPINCSFWNNRPYAGGAVTDGWNSPPGVNLQYNGTSPREAYFRLAQQVWPILTVAFMPANVSRQSGIGEPIAQMTCLRAYDREGSLGIPYLPAGHPITIRDSTWWGVRVGIPVAIVGAILVAVLAWFFWRRKRRSTHLKKESERGFATMSDGKQIDGSEVYQLSDKQAPTQLPANHKVEMSAGPVPRLAKGSDGNPQEMLANVPNGKS
jgi:hypothetical protein